MNRDEVRQAVEAYLREEFGRFLRIHDVARVRRVAGDVWRVSVVVHAGLREIPIADLEVDELGEMSPVLEPEDVVAALQRQPGGSFADTSPPDSLGTAFEELVATGGPLDSVDAVRLRVRVLSGRGDRASLLQARELLPRLLSDADGRGATLMRMAELEQRLGEPRHALEYLEAAARDLADRFDIAALEDCAAMALEIGGSSSFSGSRVHLLLEQSRARLRPLINFFDCPSLAQLTDAERRWMAMYATLRALAPGEFLVKEGDPSRSVFVVRSGLISVLLEQPSGGTRLVRCCFPSWLLGESSVLIADDPRCTASLRAERVSEVWEFDRSVVLRVMAQNEGLRDRIAATKQLHRIDSFFSMHRSLGQLEVAVRDQLLACILRIEPFDADTVLVQAGQVPHVGYLVARGEVELRMGVPTDAGPTEIVGPDGFLLVRDALHGIPSGLTATARKGAAVALFDAGRLRALGDSNPPHVVATLERL